MIYPSGEVRTGFIWSTRDTRETEFWPRAIFADIDSLAGQMFLSIACEHVRQARPIERHEEAEAGRLLYVVRRASWYWYEAICAHIKFGWPSSTQLIACAGRASSRWTGHGEKKKPRAAWTRAAAMKRAEGFLGQRGFEVWCLAEDELVLWCLGRGDLEQARWGMVRGRLCGQCGYA